MKKFAIVYGQAKTDLQKRAIEELTSTLLNYTFEYPVCLCCNNCENPRDYTCIYIGTKENNPYIRSNSIKSLAKDEEYNITVKNDTVMIEGYDDAGVLYGVLDFYNKYILKFDRVQCDGHWTSFSDVDMLPDFEYGSAPSVKERGLWTWGHVIYDYRGYFDNMMKLKMNKVVIWNDFAPINADDIVKYAHSRNIKVFWGFSWLWDTQERKVDIKNLDGRSDEILAKYESQYANICADGIYFQTFTEKTEDNIDGVLIAEAAANFVNKTSAMFYEKYPNIEIEFGLHATSVKNRLEFIKTVDPRIRIVWEDCGAFPFSDLPNEISKFDSTKELIGQLSTLRGQNDRFGAVTKSLVKLDWLRFEHLTAPQYIGVSTEYMQKNRIERKSKMWRFAQAGWLVNSDKASETVKELCRLKGGDLCILALVEDGMFEKNIMYPIALYSEMLWDCKTNVKTLIGEVALRDYITFA